MHSLGCARAPTSLKSKTNDREATSTRYTWRSLYSRLICKPISRATSRSTEVMSQICITARLSCRWQPKVWPKTHIPSSASRELMAICDASTLLDELIKTFEFADVSYRERGLEKATHHHDRVYMCKIILNLQIKATCSFFFISKIS